MENSRPRRLSYQNDTHFVLGDDLKVSDCSINNLKSESDSSDWETISDAETDTSDWETISDAETETSNAESNTSSVETNTSSAETNNSSAETNTPSAGTNTSSAETETSNSESNTSSAETETSDAKTEISDTVDITEACKAHSAICWSKFQNPKETWRKSGRRRMQTSAWKPEKISPRKRPSSNSGSSCENIEIRGRSIERHCTCRRRDDVKISDCSINKLKLESDISDEEHVIEGVDNHPKSLVTICKFKIQYPKVTWRRSGRKRMPTSAWKTDKTPPRKRPASSSGSRCETLETRGRSRIRRSPKVLDTNKKKEKDFFMCYSH